jgi:hypothetical protein
MKITGAFAIAALSLCLSDQPAFSWSKGKWTDDSHWNIHTRIIINFHKSGQTVCFSHNSNGRPVRVKYDVYPIWTRGSAVHGTMEFTMKTPENRKFFGGLNSDRPRCILLDSYYQ